MRAAIREATINHILKWEGGLSDHPADAGGITNRGITLPTLSRWLGREATREDMLDLDEETTRAIYGKFFIDDMPYDKLSDPWTFRYIVDMGVLHTQHSLACIVQKACAPFAKIDGHFGPQTFGAVEKLSMTEGTHEEWKTKLRQQRVLHYARRVAEQPSQVAFLEGWVNRAYDL